MIRLLTVLRPEPGNAATCARIVAAGGAALALPLFEIRPLPWEPPPVEGFDALILTSANAVRHGGAGLAHYRDLPVFAVGAATADAARAAGFRIAATSSGDAAALGALASQHGVRHALHLTGRDRTPTEIPAVTISIPVYASEHRDIAGPELAALAGTVALIHSPRAGRRLADLALDAATVRIGAISAAALDAAGPGWAATAVAARPDDAALIAAALALAD